MKDYIASLQPYFGKWYLGPRIGQGTYGSIYSIHHDESGVRLHAAMKVIKVPKSPSAIDELRIQGYTPAEMEGYFQKQVQFVISEINIMNRFRGHDNIVCYEDHTVVRVPKKLEWYILIRMERLERLEDYYQRVKANCLQVMQLWYDIASALADCHSCGVIHRDIKPDNVLVSKDGYYKLVDFGISRYLGDDFATTMAGTYPYMAPEVYQHKAYDHRADIYSLGIMIYQMLNAGRIPFLQPYPKEITAADKDQAVYTRFSGKPIPPIPGVPQPIMRVLLKCVAYNQQDRYQNAGALIKDIRTISLTPAEEQIPLYDERGLPVPMKATRRMRISKKSVLIALACLAALCGAGLMVYYLMTH